MSPLPTSLEEVKALARLLDDPTDAVQMSVRGRLGELGHHAVPYLMAARDEANAALRPVIDETIRDLHFEHVHRAWSLVLDAAEVDLERGAFLLAFYRFPDLDIPAYRAQLDAFADQAREHLSCVTGVERAFVLAEFMCETLGFSGNDDHYYDPDNSYLNRVIDRRLGIPVSLSVMYLLLGQRLDLPVYGINMPAHFLAGYAGKRGDIYLDLFNGGAYVSKEACIRFLLKAGVKPHPNYFQPTGARDILLRMGRNLLVIAQDTGRERTAADLRQLLAPWTPSIEE